MKQGTISIAVGCHSVIHSVLVLLAWRRLYKRWPRAWEVVCIFIHDVGHWGLNYLDDVEQKKEHWKLGAKIGKWLFGQDAFDLLAGHCSTSGFPKSQLYYSDKYSWYIAPDWWLWLNTFAEPKLRMGYNRWVAVHLFKKQVRESIESGAYQSTHAMYLKRCK